MKFTRFSRRQLMAMTWWNRPKTKDRDALICHGAVRSGKTLAMVMGFFLWSMATFDGQVFALCGKTVGALRRNIIIHLSGWLSGVVTITENRSENKLVVTDRGGRKNTYYLFGGQDEGAAAVIQGITLAGALLDEVVLMPRSFVEQACARCSVKGSKMWFSCNPGSPEHWFYKEWICNPEQKNALCLGFTMGDNPGLDPQIRQRYERLYTGVFYRRFVLGHWCGAEGLVYEFDREKHVSEDIPQEGRYYISVDYGIQNPFSAGLWRVSGGKAYRIKEYYYSGREAGRMRTDEEHYEALEQLAGAYPVELVVVDPSAASFIATVRRHGRFSVRKAKNSVIPGIQLVSSLLKQGRLVFSPKCENAIREFGLYSWEEEGDAPRKENDHAMDEIRYFVMTVMRREKDDVTFLSRTRK